MYLMVTDDLTEFMLWIYPGFLFTGAVPHNHLGNTPLVLAFVISSILINGILYAGLAAIIATILAQLRGGVSRDRVREV